MAKSELLAIYDSVDGAADAVEGLRAAGFADTAVDVVSGVPYPEGAFGEPHTKHRLYTFPFAGAACGFALGVAWLVGAQVTLPLVTGGKPIVALPAVFQILYEGTMIGAVLFTVLGVLFESRLPDGISLYDDRLGDGYIGVSLNADDDAIARGRDVLAGAGAVDILDSEGSLLEAAPSAT